MMYERVARSERMVAQELAMSCGAACARQLLLDDGIDVEESAIRDESRFDSTYGIDARGLAITLNKYLHPTRYSGGSVSPSDLGSLARLAPFLALIRAPERHWIIVDKLDDEYVYIRDPADRFNTNVGVEGVLRRDVFLERWRRTTNVVVYRCATAPLV